MDPVLELIGVTRRYVPAILTKPDLAEARTDHRRVPAVLRHLSSGPGPPPR